MRVNLKFNIIFPGPFLIIQKKAIPVGSASGVLIWPADIGMEQWQMPRSQIAAMMYTFNFRLISFVRVYLILP
jgi:hypothetical protein